MPSQPPKHGRAKRKRVKNAQVKARQGKRLYATYHKVWRAHREAQLNKQPLCEHCLLINRVTPATDVDHKNGRADRESDYVSTNYQSLCKACHGTKTRSEQ